MKRDLDLLETGAKGKTSQVLELYEKYPYPSSYAEENLILDLANMIAFTFPNDDFSCKNILDIGCGTGHRLAGFAKLYPKASFVGMDMCEASLNIARQLVNQHSLSNVSLIKADITNYDPTMKFDLITSTGVLHHLEDPDLGFKNIYHSLKPEGMMVIWLYHAIGEYFRILECELARIFFHNENNNFVNGLEILKELGLGVSNDRYGSVTSYQDKGTVDKDSINIDAYLHPIVKTYRFLEIIQVLFSCGMDWGGIVGVNKEGDSKLIDLNAEMDYPYLCLSIGELFTSPSMLERFKKLTLVKKLKIVEILWKPTGFTVIAGKGQLNEIQIAKRILPGILNKRRLLNDVP